MIVILLRGANNWEGRNMPDWQATAKVRNIAVTLSMLAALPTSAAGQFAALAGKTAGAQVLVIGSYHMSNPGLDAIRVPADDVRTEKRQREIDRSEERRVGKEC